MCKTKVVIYHKNKEIEFQEKNKYIHIYLFINTLHQIPIKINKYQKPIPIDS
jgi:hypothetical protein